MSINNFSRIIRGLSFNDSLLASLEWMNIKDIAFKFNYQEACILLERYNYKVKTEIDSD